MLKTVSSITRKYPALIYTGIGGLLVQFVFSCWWVVSIFGLANAANANVISSGTAYGLMIYSLFTFYWTTQGEWTVRGRF